MLDLALGLGMVRCAADAIDTLILKPGGKIADDVGRAVVAAGAHPSAANDNIGERIAREIRHAVNGWRHGAAVDTFAAERAEVLAAWGDLRQRARDKGRGGGAQPRLPPDPRASRALMKQAASFRARPQVFERLLAERAGIGEGQIEELAEVHARAGRYLRSAVSKAAHAARQDAEHEETGLVEAIAAGTTAPSAEEVLMRQAGLLGLPDYLRMLIPDQAVSSSK